MLKHTIWRRHLINIVIIFVSHFLSYLYLQQFVFWEGQLAAKIIGFAAVFGLYFLLDWRFKITACMLSYFSLNDFVRLFALIILCNLGEAVVLKLLAVDYAISYMLLVTLLGVIFSVGVRALLRLYVSYLPRLRENKKEQERVLIVGAGSGAEILIRSLEKEQQLPKVVIKGLVDDNPKLAGSSLAGIPVKGKVADVSRLVEEEAIDRVIVAIPSLSPDGYQKVMGKIPKDKVDVSTMPSIGELVLGNVSITKLRPVDIASLLGREEVQFDKHKTKNYLKEKIVLITGAGGSIGSEICRNLLLNKPKRLILLGHGEHSIYQIHRELQPYAAEEGVELIPVIADIQDRTRMFEVMEKYKPHYVYHAAAHKHVPLMEANVNASIHNNVFGTQNVAEAAKYANVQKFVMVSTDKAVNPPNVMGATKRLAEMIVTGLNEPGKTKFCAVRFGNVLGSRGSVVPLFKHQLEKGGPLTVTDFRMTRYFMTIPEASRLVIQASILADGGEIFILDMGEPVRIKDLAERIIELSGYKKGEIDVVETGIRPGEKLYEELLVSKELAGEQIHQKIFLGKICGFSFEKVQEFLNQLPYHEEEELKKEVIRFANLSSKE